MRVSALFASLLVLSLLGSPRDADASTRHKVTKAKKGGAHRGAKRSPKKTKSTLAAKRAAASKRQRASDNGFSVEATRNALVEVTATWRPGAGREFGQLQISIRDARKGARGRRNTGESPAEIAVSLRPVNTRHNQFTGGTGLSANAINYGFSPRTVKIKVERDDTTAEVAQKVARAVRAQREDGVPYYSASAEGGTVTIRPGGALE